MTTVVRGSDRSSVDFDEALESAKRIYEAELLPKYIDSHRGRYIIVDGISGDHEIAQSSEDSDVLERFYARNPNAVSFETCVGNPTAPTLPMHPTWDEARNEWPWNQIPFEKPARQWPKRVKLLRR